MLKWSLLSWLFPRRQPRWRVSCSTSLQSVLQILLCPWLMVCWDSFSTSWWSLPEIVWTSPRKLWSPPCTLWSCRRNWRSCYMRWFFSRWTLLCFPVFFIVKMCSCSFSAYFKVIVCDFLIVWWCREGLQDSNSSSLRTLNWNCLFDWRFQLRRCLFVLLQRSVHQSSF